MMLKTVTGVEVGGAVTHPQGKGLDYLDRGTNVQVQFRFRAILAPGTYFLNAGVVAILDEGESFLDRCVDATMFKILPEPDSLVTGIADLDIEPRVVMDLISTSI